MNNCSETGERGFIQVFATIYRGDRWIDYTNVLLIRRREDAMAGQAPALSPTHSLAFTPDPSPIRWERGTGERGNRRQHFCECGCMGRQLALSPILRPSQ